MVFRILITNMYIFCGFFWFSGVGDPGGRDCLCLVFGTTHPPTHLGVGGWLQTPPSPLGPKNLGWGQKMSAIFPTPDLPGKTVSSHRRELPPNCLADLSGDIFAGGKFGPGSPPPPPRWSRSGRQWPKVRDFFEGMVMILLSNMSLSACSYEPPRGGFEWLSFQKKESRLTEFFLGSGKWPHPSRGGRLPLWYGWGQQVRGPSQWCSGGGGGLHGHF